MLRSIVISFLFLISTVEARSLNAFEATQSPIGDFVHWVSLQTNENIILGRGVGGVITVHVSRIDSSDVMALFIHVMNANGYLVVESDGFYSVVIDPDKTVELEPVITKIYVLNHISSVKGKVIFDSLLAPAAAPQGDNDGDFSVTVSSLVSAHVVSVLPANNSLLVSASEDKIFQLDLHFLKIDLPVKQVLIEAIIVESDISKQNELGVNLSTALLDTGFSFISNQLGSIKRLSGLSQGGHFVYRDGGDIRALVSALNRDSTTNILSTPKIFVMDKNEGRIAVGQNVPFLVGTKVTENGDTIQEIERRDVGVTLTVTPTVLGNGKIVLDILQESSSVTNSTIATDIITNNRSIRTVAQVSDGQSILLGGLINHETRTSTSGIPLLMDIPWLGWLFSYDVDEVVNRELTVMIKTTLI